METRTRARRETGTGDVSRVWALGNTERGKVELLISKAGGVVGVPQFVCERDGRAFRTDTEIGYS